MNIPDFVGSLFQKKTDAIQVYLSLYLDVHSVAVAFWSMDKNGSYTLLAEDHATIPEDSWEARSVAVDRLIGILEDKTGHEEVEKAILGLPTTYLTQSGEIKKEVLSQIKHLTKTLELTPIGFVPLHQAVIYKMKKDEGIPPSVILLGVNSHAIAITIYKIGALVGLREIEKNENVSSGVEVGLKSFTDLEVLPARMLLYGPDAGELEEIKSKLMRHQWTSRVNFLHFPKIDVISASRIIEAVSLAGASELGMDLGKSDDEQPASVPVAAAPEAPINAPVAVAAAVATSLHEEIPEHIQKEMDEEVSALNKEDDQKQESEEEPIDEVVAQKKHEVRDTLAASADSTPSDLKEQVMVTEEVAHAQEVISEDFAVEEATSHADANVVMVDAESLGFKKDIDVLEEEQQLEAMASEDEEEDGEEGETQKRSSLKLPSMNLDAVSAFFQKISFPQSSGPRSVGIVGVIIFAILLSLGYWFLPHATVTIIEIPNIIEASEVITIDPTAPTVDAKANIIPGNKREKSVSGEKTIPVNGKKNIGDPAKGIVTIYNKSLSEKTFKKGSVIVTGSLQFTLDADVKVASASENVGSITFGKADVNVTAANIGAAGNITGSNEFTFKDVSSGTAIARSEKTFTGGSSKEVTVVTRADYDAFVKEMSETLIEKAKTELASSVAGGEKLIDSTIKTTVTEKVFSQELDQEATQLDGKLTLSVSGIAYNQSDIRMLLTTVSSDKIPSGYSLSDEQTVVTASNVQVKKDGTMTATASMSARALPVLDTASIQKALAGKSIKNVEAYLRALPGIGGVEVAYRLSPTKTRLPMNKKNISISIVQSQ